MNDLMNFLRLLPRPAKWMVTFFVFAGAAFALGRFLKLGNKTWILIVGVLVICAALGLYEYLRGRGEKKKAREFEGKLGLSSRQSGVGKEEIREALAELSEKWQGSVAQLRQAGMSIYDLPWYLLIGEPQSGKSTTLKKSGLEFPVGSDALSGSGGTRNCDWWFTNEAVILDTAGRFTFQEESAPDAHEWEAFLKLLRKNRKYCPINGAIVVIPATSLVEDVAEEQEKKAKNIRQKLLHLQKVLEIRFPIFILVTKADRVLGFTEFFSKIDPTEQRQLFGWSNPKPPEEPWDLKSFEGVFDEIVDRIHRVRVRLLKDEDNPALLDKLFVFPEELAAVKEPLATYLHTLFAANRFEEPFLFRGFYITSGVQQGRPIALACRDLLRVQVGDPQGVLEDLEQVFTRSRAFFIDDFYKKKLFPEQGLIARTRAALKRDKTYRRVVYGMTAALLLAIVPTLVIGGMNLYKVLGPINATVTGAKKCLNPTNPVERCTVAETYGLIRDFEAQKQNVRAARWTMRFFLRSAERNEISADLIPAIQAQLFRQGVLEPVLASFDARAAGLTETTWGPYVNGYEGFRDGFADLLRLKVLADVTTAPDKKEILYPQVQIGHALRFLKATPGLDAGPEGKAIDEWLRGEVDLAEADQIFKAAMGTKPDWTGLAVPQPTAGHNAFRAYWTITNVARWDATLDRHLREYKALSEGMMGLAVPAALPPGTPAALPAATAPPPAPVAPAAPAAPAAPVAPAPAAPGTAPAPTAAPAISPTAAAPAATAALSAFGDLGARFAKNFTDGAAHFKTDRQAPGAKRPGATPREWVANCTADYGALLTILPLTSSPAAATHCGALPAAAAALEQGRGAFLYLLSQTPEPGGKIRYAWSPDAARVAEPFTALGALTAPAAIDADGKALRDQLAAQRGSVDRLAVLTQAYTTGAGARAVQPLTSLREMMGTGAPVAVATPAAAPAPGAVATPAAVPPAAPVPPVSPAFRIQEGLPRLSEMAALAMALRLLPPAADFFESNEAFGLGCSGCFYLKHAEDHVPPANKFLSWARANLGPANGNPEVAALMERIDGAEYAYLEELIRREQGGGGGFVAPAGGGGGGSSESFSIPGGAAGAGTWRAFVADLRRWQPVIERAGGGGGGGGGGFVPPQSAGSTGLTMAALEGFVADNDKLKDLLEIFRTRQQGRADAAARAAAAAARRPVQKIPPELIQAAEQFKRCVSGLEDDALKAWRQLASGEGGVSLADFHAFSTNLRLKGNPYASRMVEVEKRGARLLVQEVQPAFNAKVGGVWDRVRGANRYPFLSPGDLRAQQVSYRNGPPGGIWSTTARDAGQRTTTDTVQLATAEMGVLDRIFFEGGSLDALFNDFALDPIVEERERMIDFVGAGKARLRGLRQWQRFLFGDGRTTSSQQVKVRLLTRESTAPRVYMGERMGQINLFGPFAVRPSTDAQSGRVLNMTLTLGDAGTSIIGRNEDKAGGWTGVLSLRGGPLKIPYLVQLASDGRPREGGKIWTTRLQLPDYQQPQQRLEGIFEFTFDRPLPEVVADGP